MQAQTAARFEDVLAHVTFTGAGRKGSRLVPLWASCVRRPEYGTRGIKLQPRSGRAPAGAPSNKPTAATPLM
eukprot:scaffold14726_cov62-Phaeocystis_antarctica.AAC.3